MLKCRAQCVPTKYMFSPNYAILITHFPILPSKKAYVEILHENYSDSLSYKEKNFL